MIIVKTNEIKVPETMGSVEIESYSEFEKLTKHFEKANKEQIVIFNFGKSYYFVSENFVIYCADKNE